MLIIYTFVFSIVFKARWQSVNVNTGIGEYAITLFAGLIPFNLFSEVMNRAPTIVLNYPNYVKKVVFPLEILVVVIVGTATLTSFISIGILVVVNLILAKTISPTIIFLPLIYFPLQLLSLGFGWFLASLGVYIRDIGQGIAIVMQLLLFATPVLYPATSIPEQYHLLIKINPLAMIVGDFRNLLLWGQLFPIKEWLFWLILSIILSIVGYVWFMGTKKGFPDVL
jgi:lipopolysaccharide transport system permease protein